MRDLWTLVIIALSFGAGWLTNEARAASRRVLAWRMLSRVADSRATRRSDWARALLIAEGDSSQRSIGLVESLDRADGIR